MKPIKIVFVGDSITGWSDLGKWLKYSHVVQCMIEARFGAGRAVVLNRGIGGNTTADLLQRLEPDVLAEKPDVVVMMIGGNDGKKNRESTAANLEQIVAQTKAFTQRVLLLQYHVLPWPDAPAKAWTFLDKNNDLIAAAATRHGCPLLNMAPVMQAAVDDAVAADEKDYRKLTTWRGIPKYRTSDLVGVDGVHLNPGGELVFARAVFAKLVELGWLE